MKPKNLNKNSIIRRAKFKVPWYKSMIKDLRNSRKKDYKNDATIILT
jgi:hypothetical protein